MSFTATLQQVDWKKAAYSNLSHSSTEAPVAELAYWNAVLPLVYFYSCKRFEGWVQLTNIDVWQHFA